MTRSASAECGRLSLAERLQSVLQVPHGEDPVLARLLDQALYGPLREFLARPGKGFRAQLVELVFRLEGGLGALPVELPLLVECLHAGSLIVDDIQDGSESRRGAPTMHRRVGMPLALNAGNFMYFLPQRLLAQVELAEASKYRVQTRLGQCLLRCHEGQALDLSVRLPEVAAADMGTVVRRVSVLKTGALMGLAAALGAVAAGASEARVEQSARFGEEAGVALQMLDDLSGVLNPQHVAKGLEDLQEQRVTWAWACLAGERVDSWATLLDEALAGAAEPALGLLERMRFPLAVHGSVWVRAQMARALAVLQSGEVGASAARLRPVEQALAELERRFLEG